MKIKSFDPEGFLRVSPSILEGLNCEKLFSLRSNNDFKYIEDNVRVGDYLICDERSVIEWVDRMFVVIFDGAFHIKMVVKSGSRVFLFRPSDLEEPPIIFEEQQPIDIVGVLAKVIHMPTLTK